MERRLFLQAGALAALACITSLPVLAQDAYPTRSIRLVVPFAAGGTADLVARIVAEELETRLGQSIVVDDRPGAGGALGAEMVAAAAPDGYTIGLGSVSSHAINFVLRSDLKYDPVEDFAPLALLAGVPNAMVVSAGLPVESAEEFVAYAKERPGKLNFGSVGMGTSQHLGGELFKMRTGIDMLHVPYNNNALLLGDLANGKIHVVFDNLPNVLGQVQAGTLKALGVTTAERSPQVPDLPTLTEEGIADFNISSWVALFAPAGLPEDIQQRLSEEIVAVVAMPEVQEKLRNAGTLPLQGGAAELRAFVEGEIARWTEVVGTAGMAK